MPIDIFGHLTHRDESEAHLGGGASLDPAYVVRQARAHEDAGFDGVLIGGGGDGPDNLQIAALAVANTTTLQYLVAHRPGLVNPTAAARTFATLDQISGGRLRVHVITGRQNDGQNRYGDPVPESERYARTGEFMQVLKQTWTSRAPFDYSGRFFQLRGFVASVFPHRQPRIPVSFAGNSDTAFPAGAAQADHYAFYAQPLSALRDDIARVRQEASKAGRADAPRITVLVRLIVGDTDEHAWQQAERLRGLIGQQAEVAAPQETRWVPARDGRNNSTGDQRQVDFGALGEKHDRALWTGLVSITERGKSTALVGSAETVVAALLDYIDAGVSTFIIDGFFREADVPQFGASVIPLLRDAVRRRDAALGTAQAGAGGESAS